MSKPLEIVLVNDVDWDKKNPCGEYLEIPGFPGYRVGSDGSVWGCRKSGKGYGKTREWKRLKVMIGSAGYPAVNIRRNGKSERIRVHILVLTSFVGPCPEGMECRHYPNRDPADVRLCNIQWSTHTKNIRDRKEHNTDNSGVRNGMSKITEESAMAIISRRSAGESLAVLSADYGLSKSTLSMIANGKRWKHVGSRGRE